MWLWEWLSVLLPDGAWFCGEVALPRLAVGALSSSASRVGAVVSTGMSDLYVMVKACVGGKPGVPFGVVGGVVVTVFAVVFVVLVACRCWAAAGGAGGPMSCVIEA